jgi:small subunit ribosomal protein S16
LLVIRLARTGRTKYPTYRVVAAESARAATGKFVAVLGNYNPHTKEIVLKTDEIKRHLANGAQPSNSVIRLLQREKIDLPAWAKLKTKAPKPKEAPAANDPAQPDTEAQPAAEERVGEVAEAAATEAEANEPNIDATETAASAEAEVEAAAAGEDAAAAAATEAE